MTRSWHEVFKGGAAPDESVAAPDESGEEQKSGWFRRFKESLSKSRQTMQQHLSAVMFDKLDADLWERLEETLIFADCGVNSTVAIVERMEQAANDGKIIGKDQLFSHLEPSSTEMFVGGHSKNDVSRQTSALLMHA